MDSLYGGRPGSPFILKATYKSISEMNECFARGNSYTACYYGEYCMIDTVDKLDANNGKIYRRDYTGATYIGQIVGPNGMEINNITIRTYTGSEVVYDGSTFKTKTLNGKDKYYPSPYILKKPEDEVEVNGSTITLKSGYRYITYDVTNKQYDYTDNGEYESQTWTCFLGYYNVIKDFQLNVETGNLTKEYTAAINDSETNLTWVKNIKVDNDGTIHYDTTTGLDGEVEYGSVDDKKKDYKQSNLISWIDKISLDKETGKFNITLNNASKSAKYINNNDNSIIISQEEYEELSEDNRLNYTKENNDLETVEGISQINKDFTWVKNISINEDGTVYYDTTTGNGENVEFGSNDDDKTKDYKQTELISWINSISLDKETGKFNITLNNDTQTGGDLSVPENETLSQINKDLTWVKNIKVDNDGTIHYDTTTGNGNEVELGSNEYTKEQDYKQSNIISWIDKISLDKESGAFNITLNNASKSGKEGSDLETISNVSQLNKNLTWVKNIHVDNDGTIHYDVTTGGNNQEVEFSSVNDDKTKDYKQSQLISWLTNIGFDTDKSSITFTGNNGKLDKTYYLPYIKNIQYDNSTGILTGGYVDSAGKNATVDLNNDDENKISYINELSIVKGEILAKKNNSDDETIRINNNNYYNSIDNIAFDANNGGKLTITYTGDSNKPKEVFSLNAAIQLKQIFESDDPNYQTNSFDDFLTKFNKGENGLNAYNTSYYCIYAYKQIDSANNKEEVTYFGFKGEPPSEKNNYVVNGAWTTLGNITSTSNFNTKDKDNLKYDNDLSWTILTV